MDKVFDRIIYKLMSPVVQILLRKGVAFGEFGQTLKRVYIDTAERQLLSSEAKATTSRIAIVTGLTRKEVGHLRKQETDDSQDRHVSAKYNRSVRVISGWLEDDEFTTPDGFPRTLPLHAEKSSFESLVSRYSGDMPVRAMLDELERVGVVEKIGADHVSLLRHAYIPAGDETENLSILAEDVPLLISTIRYNLDSENGVKRFQRKVCYDNLPPECLETFQKLAAQKGQHLLETLNEFLVRHDRDHGGNSTESGRVKAGVGIYYFEEQLEDDSSSANQPETSDG